MLYSSAARHKDVDGHETVRKEPPSPGTVFQADAPAVGLVELTTSSPSSTATHSDSEAHETPMSAACRLPSTCVLVQLSGDATPAAAQIPKPAAPTAKSANTRQTLPQPVPPAAGSRGSLCVLLFIGSQRRGARLWRVRFLIPLSSPCVRFSRTRLSDDLRGMAYAVPG